MAGSGLYRPGMRWLWTMCHAPATVWELLTTAPEGADWRAENLRLTQAAEQLAAAAPEVLPLCDRWDDLCVLALVLGLRR